MNEEPRWKMNEWITTKDDKGIKTTKDDKGMTTIKDEWRTMNNEQWRKTNEQRPYD